jgi:transposase
VVLRRRMQRETVIAYAAKLPACVVAMEACCGAHHIGRLPAAQGHEVRLMSPEYVRPYVKAQKNDDRDAEAIAEAATRPTMRFVALKSEVQLDMQTLHRVRDRLAAERTSLMNQIRALLIERGIGVPLGRAKLMERLAGMIRDPAGQSAHRAPPRRSAQSAGDAGREDPRARCRVCRAGPGRRAGTPLADHPWHRRAECDRARRGSRQREQLQSGP